LPKRLWTLPLPVPPRKPGELHMAAEVPSAAFRVYSACP
jgi:hypothetical protein